MPEVLNPVKESTIMWANLGGSVVIENVGIHGIYIGVRLCDHNRASPKLDGYLSSSVPMLSVSDAEHGVTHNSCTSGTAAAAVSTTRLRSRACHQAERDEGRENPSIHEYMRGCVKKLARPLCV